MSRLLSTSQAVVLSRKERWKQEKIMGEAYRESDIFRLEPRYRWIGRHCVLLVGLL